MPIGAAVNAAGIALHEHAMAGGGLERSPILDLARKYFKLPALSLETEAK